MKGWISIAVFYFADLMSLFCDCSFSGNMLNCDKDLSHPCASDSGVPGKILSVAYDVIVCMCTF